MIVDIIATLGWKQVRELQLASSRIEINADAVRDANDAKMWGKLVSGARQRLVLPERAIDACTTVLSTFCGSDLPSSYALQTRSSIEEPLRSTAGLQARPLFRASSPNANRYSIWGVEERPRRVGEYDMMPY